MAPKLIKILELHYTMIMFLIMIKMQQQTFSSREQEIFVSVSVCTVPLLFVTSITLQLFLYSPTLSINDTKHRDKKVLDYT